MCVLPSSLRGSKVWIMSWKMLFLISELCREAQLPSLCSLGLACKYTKTYNKKVCENEYMCNYLASFLFFLKHCQIRRVEKKQQRYEEQLFKFKPPAVNCYLVVHIISPLQHKSLSRWAYMWNMHVDIHFFYNYG